MALDLRLRERIRVVERSMDHYDDALDRERVVSLAGRHPPAVETAVQKTVSWGRDAEQFLETVFDTLPKRTADAPALVVLPRNDRGDVAPYALAQCVLADCPYTVRPSSREAGEYVARTYHDCLQQAVRETVPTDRAERVVSALELVGPETTDLASVAPERTQLVLFGDDATLDSLETDLEARGVEIATSVRMGEGRSSSILTDSDALDAHCREVVRSTVFDKGDDCTSTSVLYVVGDFAYYDDALASLYSARDELTPGEDFAVPADEQSTAAREQLRALHPGETLADGLSILECTQTAPVREFPVPAIQVKHASDRERLLELLRMDFADRDSLTTAVYTDEQATFDALASKLPAKRVTQNRPTHEIDLFEPHQGRYLVADLLYSSNPKTRRSSTSISPT